MHMARPLGSPFWLLNKQYVFRSAWHLMAPLLVSSPQLRHRSCSRRCTIGTPWSHHWLPSVLPNIVTHCGWVVVSIVPTRRVPRSPKSAEQLTAFFVLGLQRLEHSIVETVDFSSRRLQGLIEQSTWGSPSSVPCSPDCHPPCGSAARLKYDLPTMNALGNSWFQKCRSN